MTTNPANDQQHVTSFSPRHSTDYIASASYEAMEEGTTVAATDSQRDSNSTEEDESTKKDKHRKRFLTGPEKLLASETPDELRKSFTSVASQSDNKLWHLQPTRNIVKILDVDINTGLSSASAGHRLTKYGPNALEAEVSVPVHILFLLQFANLIVLMLLFASLASIALGEYVEGFAILFIITLNATIATYQEKSASNALEALAKMSSPQCTVIRDNGTQVSIECEDLVPGDIVLLVTGDVVPADLRLVASADLKVNEMLLTGESEDVSKKFNAKMDGSSTKLTADNMVFSSTTVAAGNATGIVVETGMKTRVGSIAALLKGKTGDDSNASRNPISRWLKKYQPKLTPLQHALHQLGVLMGIIAISVCALVFIVGLIRGIRDPLHPERATWLTMIMVSVSLAVSAVPEGLPVVVTICLSSGTADMVKKHVLVRKLAAVETLGAASVICTDKTGTLTEGKMTALKLWGDFKEYDVSGKGFNPTTGEITLNGKSITENDGGESAVQVRSMLLSSVLCSNTKLTSAVDEDSKLTIWTPLGNSSEAPLVVAAAKAGIWEADTTTAYPRVVEVPFSSSRKMMITVNEVSTSFEGVSLPEGTKLVANVKGAPNYILEKCTSFVTSDGIITRLSPEQKKQVLASVDDLSSQALRVLAVAIQPLEELPYSKDCDDIDEKFEALSSPLTLLGLVASIDPERDGVKEAIATARSASIRTVMITGDYLKTAVAIAKNINLLTVAADADEGATDCSVLRPFGNEYIAENDMDEITSRTLVFARAKPEDKIEIVKSLQRQGLIAAMTGDGVNDAPALKEADIGVAMGITGTEVAKGASDMILTDDNFCSIVSAVEKGRVIYANIQKFVTFLLSTNVGEIILIFSSIASGMPIPLQPLQILILNLFSDGMPAIALSLESGDPNIMNDRPRPKTQKIIHGRLWFLVIANAVFIATAAMGIYLLGLHWNFGKFLMSDIFPSDVPLTEAMKDGLARSQTMTFVCITMTEVFRAYTVRSFSEPVFVGIFSNKWMQLAAVASIALTVMVTNIPGLMDSVFGFSYIDWYMWLAAIGGAFFSVLCGEILKWVLRSQDRATARWEGMNDGFDSVLLELRNLRHHVEHLEEKLQVAIHRPVRRLPSTSTTN